VTTIANVYGSGLAEEADGDFVIAAADSIKRVTRTGRVSIVATAPATSKWASIALDNVGYFIVADNRQHAVWRLSPDGSTQTLVARYNHNISPGQDPVAVAVDSTGNYIVADGSGPYLQLFRITPNGELTELAYGPFVPGMGVAMTLDGNGNFLVGIDASILTITPSGSTMTIVRNVRLCCDPTGIARDPATGDMLLTLNQGFGTIGPSLLKVSADGSIKVVGSGATNFASPTGVLVDRISVPSGPASMGALPAYVITTVAGNGTAGFSGDGGLATKAQLKAPWGIASDSRNLYIADTQNWRVRKVSADGTISTIAGTGAAGFIGDGGKATEAAFSYLGNIAADSNGNIYIVDQGNHRVRKVALDGTITTVAGTDFSFQQGCTGDGGPATRSWLNGPDAVAVDPGGNLYISDPGCIRKVDTKGIITTRTSKISSSVMAVDVSGNVYVASAPEGVVRKVGSDGAITTVAGTGTQGHSGDGGPAISARLNFPSSVAVDTVGTIYIGEIGRLRVVTPDGIINTIAGDGIDGYSGDGGVATNALVGGIVGIALGSSGGLFVSDVRDSVVRKLVPQLSVGTATLDLQITGLPAGNTANVIVTSPGGFTAMVSGNQNLQVAAGSYTVTVNRVAVGNLYYGAYPTQQSVNVLVGATVRVQVAYNAVIPQTTKTLDQQGMQGLVVSSDGSVISLAAASQIAQSLAPGDVLAIGITPSTPNGLLRKVVTVGQNGPQIVAMTTQATLLDAFQQASVSFTTAITPQHSHVQALRPNVIIRADDGKSASVGGLPRAAAPQSCSSDETTFMELSQTPLVQDSSGTITATGSIELCPSLEFDWNIGGIPPGLNSLTATISFGVRAHIAISGQYAASFDQRVPIATIASDPIPVIVAGLPIVLTPTLTFYLGTSGNVSVGFSVGATESASITGGISYSNGQFSRVFDQTNRFTVDPLGVDAQLTAKAYIGVTADLTVDGVLSPEFSPDAYLQFQVDPFANPWWTLTGGLEGSASVKLGIFGVDLADFTYPDLFNFSKTIAQATGEFSTVVAAPSLNSVNPNSVVQGGGDLTLAISGSNFVPGAKAMFNAAPLVTSFVSATQLTALLPGSNLTAPGTFPITVANPDAEGAVSTSFSFVVQPAAVTPTIQSLSLSAPSVTGGSSLTGTIMLSSPAPAGGVQISLSSDNPTALPNGPVTVLAGQTSATFTVSTAVVSSNQTANITATLGSSTATATLTVLPQIVAPTLQALTLSSTSVIGGTALTGTVTISGPAPTSGLQITLVSTNSNAQVPPSIIVAPGQSTASFNVTTTSVSATQVVTITATLGSSTASANLTITPAAFSFHPTAFVVNGTMTINGKMMAFEIQGVGGNADGSYNLTVDDGAALPIQFLFNLTAKATNPTGSTISFTGLAFGTYTDFSSSSNPIVGLINSATLVINFTSLSSGSSLAGNIGIGTSAGQINGSFTGTLTNIQ
jgi:hypothetical protein